MTAMWQDEVFVWLIDPDTGERERCATIRYPYEPWPYYRHVYVSGVVSVCTHNPGPDDHECLIEAVYWAGDYFISWLPSAMYGGLAYESREFEWWEVH